MSDYLNGSISETASYKKRFEFSPSQILVFGFATVILLGAVLLSMPFATMDGHRTYFLNALFTSTSAVCVTGLVVVDTGTYWSLAGQVIILLLIQVGGLGFMTMATFFFLLLGKRIGLKTRLVMQASLNRNHVQGIVNLGRHILIFTFALELFFATVLAVRWSFDMGIVKAMWFGLFHSVSAFNNAGFDLFGEFKSLMGYAADPVVNLSITALIILGGIGFGVVMEVKEAIINKARLHMHTKLVLATTLILLLIGTVLIFVFEYNNTLKSLSLSGKLMASFFQSVTPRTAGYNTLDIGALYGYTQLLIIMLMFIGASPGSTGGGIKTTTLAVLGASIMSLIRGETSASVFRRNIPQVQVAKSMAIFILAILTIVSVSAGLMISEGGHDFLTILFETVSAFGTVGLSMGFTPHLTGAGKLLIIFTMFVGRIGTMTMVLALAERRKSSANINYPRGDVMVG